MPDVPTFTWDQVRAWRLRRHHLRDRAPAGGAPRVVADIAGLHAQLASSAELTLWARTDALPPDAVSNALADRSLVKTWAMRGTLHLLPAREFATWQAAQRTRDHFRKPVWLRNFGVTDAELDRLIAAVGQALDGRMLTREELAAEVARRTGSSKLGDKVRESFGSMLKPAAFQGVLAFGPNDGQRVRFVRPDQWLDRPDLDGTDPAAALLDVLRRYLTASGPVTREELARWWGGTPAAAGRSLRALGDAAHAVDVDGTSAWMLAEHVQELAAMPQRIARTGAVRLLPAFDQYVVTATKQAEHFLPGDFADRVYRPQGWLSAVVLVDGRMDAVWRHEVKGRYVDVTVEPFGKLTARVRRGVEDEADRLAAYLGKALRLHW